MKFYTIAFLVSLLSLCVPPSAAVAAEPVTIRVWASEVPEWVETTEQMMERFRQQNPNIEVIVELSPANPDTMTVQMAAGVAPDIIAWWGGQVHDWGEQGFFLTLNDLIDKYMTREELADFIPQHLRAFNYQGRQYALPYVGGTVATWYNKNMFDSAGLTYPDESWNHDTLADSAWKLSVDRNGDGENEQYGYGFWTVFERVELWVQRFGGRAHPEGDRSRFTWDSPEAVDALEYLRHLAQDRRAYGGLFRNGTQAMYEEGSWMLTSFDFASIDFDFDFAPVVAGPKGPVSYLTTNAYAINAQTKYPEEAFAVLKFLTGTYANEMRSYVSLQPAVRSALPFYVQANRATYPRLEETNLEQFVAELEHAIPAPSLMSYNKALEHINPFIDKLIFKGTVPPEAIREIVPVVNSLIQADLESR